MSKLFFDHLIAFEEVDIIIKKVASSLEERDELWQLVDEMVHHRVLGCVLDKLPSKHHEEFLGKFHSYPHDTALIDYLNQKSGKNVEKAIADEIKLLESELLKELGFHPSGGLG